MGLTYDNEFFCLSDGDDEVFKGKICEGWVV